MPTVRNLSAGEIIPQMGFAPTQNQTGGWTATRDYYMLRSTWESAAVQIRFSRGTAITTADPTIDSLYSWMTVESKAANYEDSGTVRLTITYTGAPTDQFGGETGGDLSLAALPVYTLNCNLRDMPLSEHPKFKALSNADEKYLLGQVISGEARIIADGTKAIAPSYPDGVYEYLKDANGAEITLTSADAVSFGELLKNGVSSYLAPAFTWTEGTQGPSGMTTAQVDDMGLITEPRNLPLTAPGGRTWILSSATQEQRGDLYHTTLEWTASDRGGWDEFIYSE